MQLFLTYANNIWLTTVKNIHNFFKHSYQVNYFITCHLFLMSQQILRKLFVDV